MSSQSLRGCACWKEAGAGKQKEDSGNGGVEGHCGYMGSRKAVCKGVDSVLLSLIPHRLGTTYMCQEV